MKLQINKGDRYGILTIVKEVESRVTPKGLRRRYFLCQCDCGNTTTVGLANLRRGSTRGCGCLVGTPNITHHETKTRLYRIWAHIKRRCLKSNADNFRHYGGRGIKLCPQWMKYENFRDWALSHGYADNLTIDRIDVNGNYCPENCRWATIKQQANNRRDNHIVTINGESKTIAEWSEISGISYETLIARISNGWKEELLLAPLNSIRKTKSYKTDGFKSEIIGSYKQGKSIAEISSSIKIGRNYVVSALKRWGEYIPYNPKREVIQMTVEGEVIRKFESIAEASRQINGNTSAIIACCGDVSKTAYGFKWMYASDHID